MAYTGLLSCSDRAGVPSTKFNTAPLPTAVATVPLASSTRVALPSPNSENRTLPPASTATAMGASVAADVPNPPLPLEAAAPVPTRVVTSPPKPRMRRTRLLYLSAMYNDPVASTQIPAGR